MKWLILILTCMLCSCQAYREQFTYYTEDGKPNHTVDVSFYSFMMLGKAGKLTTETQTMEFIRNVNATGLETSVDNRSVGSIAEGLTRGLTRP